MERTGSQLTFCRLPPSITAREPTAAELASRVAIGERSFFMYRSFLEAGLRLPVPYFITEFLVWIHLAPCQLSADSYAILVCFHNLYTAFEWGRPWAQEVLDTHTLVPIEGGDHEYRLVSRSGLPLFTDIPAFEDWREHPIILTGIVWDRQFPGRVFTNLNRNRHLREIRRILPGDYNSHIDQILAMPLRDRSWHSLSLPPVMAFDIAPAIVPGNVLPEEPEEPSSSDSSETSSDDPADFIEHNQQLRGVIDARNDPAPSHLDLSAYSAFPIGSGAGK